MRALIFLIFLSFTSFSQTKQEVSDYHDSFMVPFNVLGVKITEFTTSALKQSPNTVLIPKRDDVLKALNQMKKALKNVKPIQKDFTLLAEVKKCVTAYDTYVQQNLMQNNLAPELLDARGNIKLIRKYQKVNNNFEALGKRVLIRQKKFFNYYKFNIVENEANHKIDVTRKATKYYYSISIDQFKVQANLDDFIDAFNVGDVAKMKAAKSKGILQANKALAQLSKEKPFQNDKSIIEDSKKIITYYKSFFTEKSGAMIKVHSFPKDLPNEKIDAYNQSVDDSNAALDYYNNIQPMLTQSGVVSGTFFKRHL